LYDVSKSVFSRIDSQNIAQDKSQLSKIVLVRLAFAKMTSFKELFLNTFF
jgi:hypothetical protein